MFCYLFERYHLFSVTYHVTRSIPKVHRSLTFYINEKLLSWGNWGGLNVAHVFYAVVVDWNINGTWTLCLLFLD